MSNTNTKSKLTLEQIDAIADIINRGGSNREAAREVLNQESRESTIRSYISKGTIVVGGTEAPILTKTNRKGDLKYSIPLPKKIERNFDNSRILVISDLHIPYHHQDALEFLQHLKDKYKPTRVISVGDECFPAEAEIMTENGWMTFEKYHNVINSGEPVRVVEVNEDLVGSLTIPDRLVYKDSVPELLKYEHNTMVSNTTPKHNIVKVHPVTGKLHRREAWDTFGTASWEIPRSLKGFLGKGVNFSDAELQLIVAFQADGTLTKGAMRFSFSKERKAERLESLLHTLGIEYTIHKVERGDLQYYVKVENTPEYVTKNFNELFNTCDLRLDQMEVFLEEVRHWDSNDTVERFRYTSKFRDNVDFVQQVAVLSGKSSRKVGTIDGKYYYVDVIDQAEKCSLKSAKVLYTPHNKPVYCVTVSTGMILTRQEGWVSVSGNCDKHALSFHDSDPDLASAGDELKKTLPVIKELERMFPIMDILDSNHGSMVWRKAKHFGIPKHYIKGYNEVLGVSDAWQWHNDLTIELPNGSYCYFHHGKSANVIKLSQQMGMNCVQGHYHESFKIDYWGNPTGLYWAVQSACLIDDHSYAFSYNNVNIKRPIIGTSLIIDSLPVLEPMVLGKDGRWIGRKK